MRQKNIQCKYLSLKPVLILCSAFAWTLLAQSGWAMTIRFDDLPALLQKQNFNIQSSRTRVEAAEVKTNHLTRSFLPTLRIHGGGETFTTLDQPRRTEPTAGVEARLNVFEGGRDYFEEKSRQKNLVLEKNKSHQTYVRTLQRARALFVEILYLDELKKLYQVALNQNQQNLSLVQRKIQAGLTTKTDKLDFEIERNSLKQELALLDEEWEHSVELLQALLGLDLNKPVEFSGTLKHQHDDPAFAFQFEANEHYELVQLKQQSQALAAQKNRAALWWTPSLDIYSSYELYPFHERERFSWQERDDMVAGIQLEMQLFDGLQAHRNAQSLQLQSQAVQLAAQQKARELEAEFRKLKHTLKLRHQLLHDLAKSVQQTERYLKLAGEEYALGTKNSPDLLSALQRLLGQKSRYLAMQKDFLMSKNELLSFMGR